MGIWTKKDKYVDLGEKLKKREERLENFKESMNEKPEVKTETQNTGGFFGGFFGRGTSSPEPTPTESESSEEKRKKLAKRLMDLTNRQEEQEKEIYRLKQRIEVLERKQRVGY